MKAAIEEREANGPYASLEDFCSRLDSRTVNRKVLENLVRCGAFDSLGKSRAQLFAEIERALSAGSAVQRDRISGQGSLFDDLSIASMPPPSAAEVEIPEWPKQERLAYEKELLGFYVTGHPLDDYLGSIEGGKFSTIAEAQEIKEKRTVKLGGILASVEKRFTKKDGKPMAIVVLEDMTGTLEMRLWSEAIAKAGENLAPGRAVAVSATVYPEEDGVRVSVNDVTPLKPRPSRRPVTIRLDHAKLREEDVPKLAERVRKHPGKRPLILEFSRDGDLIYRMEADNRFRVGDERALREELAEYLA